MHAYGWIPSGKDERDFRYRAPADAPRVLPAQVDLEPRCPLWSWNQGKVGSCVANAVLFCAVFAGLQIGGATVEPSRLFNYWNGRYDKTQDTGMKLRNALKSLNADGVCDEGLWPYVESRFAEKPPDEAYAQAQNHQAIVYENLFTNLDDMRTCLASGFPFCFGVPIFESFNTQWVARTGKVPFPNSDKEGQLGGHAMAAIGYDDHAKLFRVRNWWGLEWGDHGDCWMPYDYLKYFADDCWAIRRME